MKHESLKDSTTVLACGHCGKRLYSCMPEKHVAKDKAICCGKPMQAIAFNDLDASDWAEIFSRELKKNGDRGLEDYPQRLRKLLKGCTPSEKEHMKQVILALMEYLLTEVIEQHDELDNMNLETFKKEMSKP